MNWESKKNVLTADNYAKLEGSDELIKKVQQQTFEQNNVFVFSSRRMVGAASVPYVPDLLFVSPDGKTVLVGSKCKEFMSRFDLVQTDSGMFQFENEVRLKKQEALTDEVAISQKWVVSLSGKRDLHITDGNNDQYVPIQCECSSHFGSVALRLQEKAGRD